MFPTSRYAVLEHHDHHRRSIAVEEGPVGTLSVVHVARSSSEFTPESTPACLRLDSSHRFTDTVIIIIDRYRGLIPHRQNVEFIFHVAALVLYSRVWLWHTTPAAMALPGATGFGWFFRYLTFCSYTLQLVQFALCVLCRVLPSEKARVATSIAADRLACALFGLANMISAMFYTIENTGGKGLIDASGRGAKPWWLGETVHALNSVIAWIDLFLVEERTFHGHSRALIVFFIVTYCSWALVVKRVHGTFPYPLMNMLPFPWGFVGLAAAASVVLLSIFELGRRLKDVQRNGRRRRRGDPSSKKEG